MKHHDCSKDAAKQLPIILMFGGSYSTWIKECDITSNENNRIKDSHNCYAYALNQRVGNRYGKPQPGYFAHYGQISNKGNE